MQWVARVPGLWPKLLDEGQTRRLLDGLYELEVAAEAWRVDAFPDISRPRTIHEAACLDGRLPRDRAPGRADALGPLGQGRADRRRPDRRRRRVPRGHPARMGQRPLDRLPGRDRQGPAAARKSRAMRIPRDPVGEVIVVRRDPRLAFRIVENKMNYGYLGERLSQSAAENFPQLVGDLRRLATAAYVTPTTDDLLDGGDLDDFEFANSQGLVDYATLRLLWSWYRRDRDAKRRHRRVPDPVLSADQSTGRQEAPSAAWQMWTSGTRPVRRS